MSSGGPERARNLSAARVVFLTVVMSVIIMLLEGE